MSNRAVTTKERILDAAEGLMLAKSYHSVGLNEILSAVQVPKGSFYHYFSSKEQFGVELLKHYAADAADYKSRMLLSVEVEPDALRRLITFFETCLGKYLQSEGRCPCLLVKLSTEISDFSDDMRAVLAAGSLESVTILRKTIELGVAQKSIRPQQDAAATAAVIEDLWAGAMQRAAVARNVAPLRNALHFIRALLSLPETR